jgi:Gpi18-like mannosyltransferase
MKWRFLVIILFILAFIFRLSLTNTAMHDDIVVQSGWGHWIYENKTMFGFYENNNWIYGWPNQPPLISFLYGFGFTLHEWLNTALVSIGTFIALNHLGAAHIPSFYSFITWFSSALFANTPYLIGELISLKLIPIFADFALALLIYFFAKKISSPKKAVIFSLIYLYIPFSWYESAIWAQHDQLAFIFLFLSILSLNNQKTSLFSPFLFLISLTLKITGLIFAPLFLWLALKDKKTFLNYFIGIIIALLAYFILVKLISPNNFLTFNLNLQKQMLAKGDWATWVNSFNFWHLVTGFLTDSRNLFLGLSFQIWGYLIFGIFYLYAVFISQKRDFWNSFKAFYIVAFSGWLFITTMHERYLFSAVILLLLLSAKYTKLFKLWLFLAIIFTLNLYAAWWQPETFRFLKAILEWQNLFFSKLLSLFMIGIFVKTLKKIERKSSK